MSRKTGSGDHEVGYGRPPKQHQFTPGQSGNSKGRPKASRNVGALLHDKLFEPLTVTRNGRRVRITHLEGILMVLRKSALEGDARAVDQLIRLMPILERHQQATGATEALTPAPHPDDNAILQHFMKTYSAAEVKQS